MPKKKTFHHDTSLLDSIKPATFNQDQYWTNLLSLNPSTDDYDGIVIGAGAAGTGKTFLAAAAASKLYLSKQIRQIIITKPMVDMSIEKMGAIPGDANEKFEPWAATIVNPIKKFVGKNKFECDFGKNIFAEPLTFMRGKTFDDSFIIVDEAQNLTIEQLKMVLTRAGRGSRVVLCGDTSQNDLPKKYQCGLEWFIEESRRQNREVDITVFGRKDGQRGWTCNLALEIFDAAK